MIQKGIDEDIFDLIFSWAFDKDVMRWYNAVDPQKGHELGWFS